MSPGGTNLQHGGDERSDLINAIVDIMRDSWDTPADCNDGELFTYAELLLDRIQAGENRTALDMFLSGVQGEKLGLPTSDAHRAILNRALALVDRGPVKN